MRDLVKDLQIWNKTEQLLCGLNKFGSKIEFAYITVNNRFYSLGNNGQAIVLDIIDFAEIITYAVSISINRQPFTITFQHDLAKTI